MNMKIYVGYKEIKELNEKQTREIANVLGFDEFNVKRMTSRATIEYYIREELDTNEDTVFIKLVH